MLCHKDINLPSELTSLSSVKFENLQWSDHAYQALEDDRYDTIQFFDEIEFSGSEIIEAELSGTIVTKLVIRKSYNESYDICTVIRKSGTRVIVVTVWLNSKDDNHSTLKKEAYQ